MRFTFVILLFCCLGADAQMIIKAHANYRPLAQPVVNLLLDDYPNAAAAYSLRKLRTAYTGSAIRVRRSNDNTEQDIGFTSSGDLDTAALKTFTGGFTATVTTWYDQSGNARNATQTTAANQPRIVNAGTVERRSGDISLVYDGTNDFLQAASTSGLTISPTSFYAVSSRGNDADNLRVVLSTGILTDQRGYGIYYTINSPPNATMNNIASQIRYNGEFVFDLGNVTNTINTNTITTVITTTTSSNIWVNGANNSNQTYNYSNTTTSSNIIIGSRLQETTNVPGFHLNGTTSEIVIWGANQSSNRTGIENNINDYYSIY
jgi:hypothetical protein